MMFGLGRESNCLDGLTIGTGAIIAGFSSYERMLNLVVGGYLETVEI
jgi:hypothetical protein